MERKYLRLLSLVLLTFVLAIWLSGCGNKATGDFEQGSAYQDIRAEQLKAMIDGQEDIVLLDVREQFEFDEGHITDSILIPTGQITSRINELDKNKTIVVICASGARSAQVAGYLAEEGFAKVKNFADGIMTWPYPELVIK